MTGAGDSRFLPGRMVGTPRISLCLPLGSTCLSQSHRVATVNASANPGHPNATWANVAQTTAPNTLVRTRATYKLRM